jgi:HEAT repeat protein
VRAELRDLIDRMCVVEHMVNSSQSVSWAAHREAEAITDVSIVTELSIFLSGEVPKEQRKAAYFILGNVGKNIQNHECVNVLISLINKEKDKYALATLLDVLADIRIPKETDLSPAYQLLGDNRWLVRHSAIGALRNTESPEAEAHVLAHLEVAEDPHDIVYCHATLNRIGTNQAIPFLERGLKSRKRDVKVSAEQAILAIQQRAMPLNNSLKRTGPDGPAA